MLYAAIPLTVLFYVISTLLFKKLKLSVFNPILVCIGLLIALFHFSGWDFNEYAKGTTVFTTLLEPAVIALAFPLYQQFAHVRDKILPILIACLLGVVIGIITTTLVAVWLGANTSVIASLAPKAVTTPIAIAISETLGGIPAITAIIVILVGIFGNVCGPQLCKWMRIHSDEAQGLAMGSAAHVVGTSKAIEMGHTHGAFSTMALLVSAVITSVIAPLIYPPLLTLLS